MKTYRDHYFKRAKREQYPARSVYKLQEMDNQFHLLRPGQKVLDLGASPGSWTLYAAKKVGDKGQVLGVDLNPANTSFPPQVTFLQEDVFNRSPQFQALLDSLAPFDHVISDMAPKTSGIKFKDQALSLELVEEAFALAGACLAEQGCFVAKIFEGPDVHGFIQGIRPWFAKVKTFKPKSSRSESKEIFIIGKAFKLQGS
ncbi:MAG: 50S rRNA methyltransferase [Deltaproteobacteria bacterium]|nr:MAG: 50S rRNA methyltransferase [Deltaproteobacteria bacterium]